MSKTLSRQETKRRQAFIQEIQAVEQKHGYLLAIQQAPPQTFIQPMPKLVAEEAEEPTQEGARPRAPWYKRWR